MNATLTSPFLSRAIFASSLALCLGAAACSSNPATGGSGGGGSGAASTSSGSTGSTASTTSSASSGAGGGSDCAPGPGYDKGKMALTVMSGDATILDENDKPVVGQPVFICGVDVCSPPAKTDATGHGTVQYNKALDRPAFKFGDALTYAEFGIPLSMAQTSLGMLHTVKLPAAGAAMAAGKAAVSGNVTVTLKAGTTIDYSVIYATPADQQLRAASMPAMLAKPLVDPKLNLEVVYGVAPAQTAFCPAAAVSVPNDPMWPAGTAVEFYIHSVSLDQDWAPYAGWAKVSDGAVSADGKTIATADGQGLPVLEVFGIQKKP